jgi:hopanoid biosynthesis associated RND transporter like protein HpnN
MAHAVGDEHQATWTWRLMAALAGLCSRAGWPIIGLSIIMFVLSIWLTATRMTFATDRNDLIGKSAPFYRNYQAFQNEFETEDQIVIVVTSGNPDLNRKVVDRIGDLLRQDPQHFTDVMDKIDLGFIRSRLLLYMSVEDLRALKQRLAGVLPFLSQMLGDPGLVPMFKTLNDQIQGFIKAQVARVMAPGGNPLNAASPPAHAEPKGSGDTPLQPPGGRPSGAPDIAGALPILTSILSNMADSISSHYSYQSPWAQMFSPRKDVGEIPRYIYQSKKEGHLYIVPFVPVMASKGFTPVRDNIERLHQMLDHLRNEFPGVELGLTGEPVLENDEMSQSDADSRRASVISFIAIAILFALTFRNLARPALALLCLVLAIGWTMGFTTLAIGHLNIITVTAMPMLIGLGVDFGIQVIARYEEERGKDRLPNDALVYTLGGTGMSIVTAGFTTALSFLAAYFTGFRGIGELGVLAGGGLLLSLIAMVVVLPSMLLLVDNWKLRTNRPLDTRPSPLAGLVSVENILLAHPWAVLFLSAMFTLFCVNSLRYVWFNGRYFDANVLHLQTRGIESVEWEQRLLHSGKSIVSAAVIADNLEQARVLQQKLEKLPTVESVESAVEMFPTDQEEKLKIIPSIQQAMRKLPTLKEPLPPVEADQLRDIVAELRGIFFVIYPEARAAGALDVASQIRHFVVGADYLLDRMSYAGPPESAKHLFDYQDHFFKDLADKLDLIRGNGPVKPMTIDEMPPILRKQLIGRHGKFLLMVYPKEDTFEPTYAKPFIDDLRTVDPNVTGNPVMMYESTKALRESYEVAGKYAFVTITIIVLLHFFSILATVLALLPLVIGMLWMMGIMGVIGIPFNPANYMVLPLIIGIGVANGVYVVRRYQEERQSGRNANTYAASIFGVSTGRAILLSNFTAIIGFASLMVAKYTGIFSLGLVMSLGLATCMTTALVILPALLQIMHDHDIKV